MPSSHLALCAVVLLASARVLADDPPKDAPPPTTTSTTTPTPTPTSTTAPAVKPPAAPPPQHKGACKTAVPALGATVGVAVSSSCGAKGTVIYNDDILAIAPTGSVKLSFRTPRRDHDILLEETCVNTGAADIVVTIGGAEAPWMTPNPALKCTEATSELPSSRLLTGTAEESSTNPVAGITPYAFFGGILTTLIVGASTATCFYYRSIETDPDTKNQLTIDGDLLAATTGVSAVITVVLLPLLDWSLINAPPGGETGEPPEKEEAGE